MAWETVVDTPIGRSWVIEPGSVPDAVAALDGKEGDDQLRVLAAWSTAHGDADPGSHLRDAGVPIASNWVEG